MEQYFSVLKECILFRTMGDAQLEPLIKCMNAQLKNYKSEEYIFLSGDKIDYVGVVLTGSVEIIKENMAGTKHIIAILTPSDIFGEGIVCTASRISPVTVRVKERSDILLVPYERIIRTCGNSCNFHIKLIQNMMVILGEKNVKLNRKIDLLILKGMREKLASFLLNETGNHEKEIFQIALNRNELADYLNVSRTSMCRELTRMKDDGLIDYYGNSFKILNKEMLLECLEV